MLIPGGTANVLARELGLPLDPTQALEVGLRGRTRRVDLGLLSARDISRFLLFVGVGFDARVAARVRPRTKKRIGIAAYYVEVMRSLLTYNFPQFEVEAEDASYAATSCITANSCQYGGGLALTPAADMCDGELDILIVQTRRKIDYARLIWAAFFRRAPEFPWVLRRRVHRLKIKGPRGLWVQADGELAGTLPLEIDLEPASFPLIVPAQA
jgi:diacylglycerol kinase (ATP)